ncbi:MAG: pentapeptide repeat-containing protein, partial [Acidimicrobiaceae bacterium]|nr:pentapeptide repeat-containing protein [Acidimicrobiaceae bacterium]
CRLVDARLTGSRLSRGHLTDCVVLDSDFSGVFLGECRLTRVEFHRCRLSGLQALGSNFDDVAFFDCKMAEASLRTSEWQRAEFHDCDLVDSDFHGSKLPAARFERCDLSGADLSKSDLRGSRLHGSILDRLHGGEALRGVTIGSEQIVPAALAVFAALNISVGDDE